MLLHWVHCTIARSQWLENNTHPYSHHDYDWHPPHPHRERHSADRNRHHHPNQHNHLHPNTNSHCTNGHTFPTEYSHPNANSPNIHPNDYVDTVPLGHGNTYKHACSVTNTDAVNHTNSFSNRTRWIAIKIPIILFSSISKNLQVHST